VVLAALEQEGVAYVRIAPGGDLDRAPWVSMDDRLAAYEMTKHLIGLGHRDIGFIIGHPDHGASRLRHQGFMDAMRDSGLRTRRPGRAGLLLVPLRLRSGREAAGRRRSADRHLRLATTTWPWA
jgi:DNA-binding LacI/PurR family transcriptional regulator